MTLLKTVSTRLDNNNRPFTDLYLGWVHDSKVYLVRVRPHWFVNLPLLLAQAVEVPQGEELEKYVLADNQPPTP